MILMTIFPSFTSIRAFLVCANISTNNAAETTKTTNIACSVTSDQTDGLLSLETKASEESKDFVHSNFELSFTSDPLGGTYQVTKEDAGSNFDFKIKIETNSTLAQLIEQINCGNCNPVLRYGFNG